MRNLKTVSLRGLAVVLSSILLPTFTTVLGHEKKHSRQVAVSGRIVGVACYLEHGSIGEKHLACATACARQGIPLAILDSKTDTLYLPLASEHHKPANSELMPFVEKVVTVTGTLVEKSGMKAIRIEKVEAAE